MIERTSKSGEARSRPAIPVREQIREGLFGIYEQAAKDTGFSFGVLARAGKRFFPLGGRPEQTVMQGYIAVDIRKPEGAIDYAPFWVRVRELKAILTSVQGNR